MTRLVADDVAVRASNRPLLGPVSLALNAGEITALLGPNGAGKSTFVRCLLGLLDHSGRVALDGTSVRSMSANIRARSLSYLPQGHTQAWPLSVRQVVGLGRFPHGDQAENNPSVDHALSRLGLSDLSDRSVLSLSGGEQMRVALARVLAVEARFLIADEPLASLDPHYQFQILDALRSEAQQGVGVIVVMHDLALAAAYADRLILIANGQVIADGPPEHVLVSSIVQDVFSVRTSVSRVQRADGTSLSVALPIGVP